MWWTAWTPSMSCTARSGLQAKQWEEHCMSAAINKRERYWVMAIRADVR